MQPGMVKIIISDEERSIKRMGIRMIPSRDMIKIIRLKVLQIETQDREVLDMRSTHAGAIFSIIQKRAKS